MRKLIAATAALAMTGAALAAGALCAETPEWQGADRWLRIEAKHRHETGIPALGFRIVPGGGNWPRLQKNTLTDPRTTYTWPTTFCDLGEIRVPGRGGADRPEQEGDWSHVVLSYGGAEEPYLRVWASRVSPALVVQTAGQGLTLFAGRRAFAGFRGRATPVWQAGRPPAWIAAPGEGGVEVRESASPSGPGGWLLCWFGKGGGIATSRSPYFHHGQYWINPVLDEADCPVLVAFDSPPASVGADRNGLHVAFAGGGTHSVVLVPLRGDLLPLAAETDAWRGGLPEEVAAQCAWWHAHLGEVPYAVRETYARDAAPDAVSVTESLRWLRVREGGRRLAPLPPTAALALRQGFPLELTAGGRPAPYVESSVLTYFGPWGGVEDADGLTYTISGLGALVNERRVVGKAVPADAELVAELEGEVGKMLDAGHLAPWYCARDCYGAGYRAYWRHETRFTWSNPGETLYTLAQALPVLPDAMRDGVLAYMKREREEYPPERVAHTPVWEGARREWHRLDDVETFTEHQQKVDQHNFHVANGLIPEETLYYLAEYYEAVGADGPDRPAWDGLRAILEPYLERQDWATLGFWPAPIPTDLCCNGWGGVHDANLHFAGLVGCLRLAATADRDADAAWGALARTVLWRHALGRYGHYLHGRGFYVLPDEPDWMAVWFQGSWHGHMITYDWTGPLDEVRQVTRQSPYGLQLSDSPLDRFHPQSIVTFLGAVPELGRLAAAHLKPELQSFSDRYELTMPAWYVAKCTTNINAEFWYVAPEESYQVFLLRAWALGEPAEKLEGYLDTPWMARGDLYYIHKLAETIKSYRGWTWRPPAASQSRSR